MRKIADIALWVGAALGLLSLVSAVAVLVFGLVPLVFTSGSMSPEIPAGSLGIATTTDADELAIGDVVSVDAVDGVRVTHRIIDIEIAGDQATMTLKGDANAAPDSEPYIVTEADRLLFSVPWLGRVLTALASPMAIFLAGVLAAAVVGYVIMSSSRGERPRRRRGSRRAGSQRVGAAAVVALTAPGLLALSPTETTTAYFSDLGGTVTTSGFVAHRVAPPTTIECATSLLGLSMTITTTASDPRYTYWARGFNASGQPVSNYKQMTGSGSTRAATFTESDFSASISLGNAYSIRVYSRVAGTTWESSEYRTYPFSKVSVALVGLLYQCGEPDPGPAIAFTKPLNGDTGDNAGSNSLQTAISAACQDGTYGASNVAACGTASDNGSISTVEYILQRTGGTLGVRCWNGSSLWVTGCQYRAAATNASKTKWAVPRLNGLTYPYISDGTFVLTIRATDNLGNVTVRSINYSVTY